MQKYLEDYENIKHYILHYDHEEDVGRQLQLVYEYWGEHCVTQKGILWVHWMSHNEDAKSKWAELDSLVRRKAKYGGFHE